MQKTSVRKARIEDSDRMAEILREIGLSERRNSLPLEEVSKPIEKLIEHCINDSRGHSMLVAVDGTDRVLGFTCVHWVPFVMLGSWEGYVSDMFVSPEASGMGVGTTLIEQVIEEGKERGCMRLMVSNGKEKVSYKLGIYKTLGWTESPLDAYIVYYYEEPWS